LRVEGSGFRVEGSGFRIQGSGFMVQRKIFGAQQPILLPNLVRKVNVRLPGKRNSISHGARINRDDKLDSDRWIVK